VEKTLASQGGVKEVKKTGSSRQTDQQSGRIKRTKAPLSKVERKEKGRKGKAYGIVLGKAQKPVTGTRPGLSTKQLKGGDGDTKGPQTVGIGDGKSATQGNVLKGGV